MNLYNNIVNSNHKCSFTIDNVFCILIHYKYLNNLDYIGLGYIKFHSKKIFCIFIYITEIVGFYGVQHPFLY